MLLPNDKKNIPHYLSDTMHALSTSSKKTSTPKPEEQT